MFQVYASVLAYAIHVLLFEFLKPYWQIKISKFTYVYEEIHKPETKGMNMGYVLEGRTRTFIGTVMNTKFKIWL